MMRTVNRSAALTALVSLLLALPAHASVNKSIKIDAGETSDGASTVNGKISVGAGATVAGDVTSVNGSIRIDEGATVADAETVNGGLRVADKVRSHSLSTVNGSIDVASDVVVDGAVTAVNGRITVGGGSKVANDLGNVNGDIELDGSEIGGDVSTVMGDVELADGAVIMGDDSKLYQMRPGGEWLEIADLEGAGVRGISRLAINEAGNRIALVGNR